MANRNLTHLILEGVATSKEFNGRGGGGGRPGDVPDRQLHAKNLIAGIESIQEELNAHAYYIEVIGRPGEEFLTNKFDVSGLSVLRVQEADPDRGIPARATVMANKKSKGITKLRKKISDFAERDGKPNNKGQTRPMNADLAQSISAIKQAGLQELWRHPTNTFPDIEERIDWEVWINPDELDVFIQATPRHLIEVHGDRLFFPEDTVILAQCTGHQLAAIVMATGVVRAVAQPGVPVDFVDHMEAEEQTKWVDELVARTKFTHPESGRDSYVTILDTGVSIANPLIRPVLDKEDRHASDPGWDIDDKNGHGTGMAGLAVYGDLRPVLESLDPVVVQHRLESSKIIPDMGQNPHHLLGYRTRKAIDMVEVKPERIRAFSLASTTDSDSPHSGAPTSWSTEIDQLAAGVSGEVNQPRLIVVSTGNVQMQPDGIKNYLDICDHPDSEIYSPAQAWNIITVGAMTEKNGVGGDTYGKTLAKVGDIAPVSRTASWTTTWPIKPDIVMEGGNWFADGFSSTPNSHSDLRLVTTSRNFPGRSFIDMADTSAATALAARELAILRSEYPKLWLETIRALYVGSARWTDQMWSHVPADLQQQKKSLAVLFKRYGYGKPDLSRAMKSAANAATLIVQDEIRPYEDKASARKLYEMKIFDLPWPTEKLRELGNSEVTLRVALSTFIEPNPSETARGRKSRYASHALRFNLKGADETMQQFTDRIGRIEDGDENGAPSDNIQWQFGANRRNVGSLHIDTLTCKASDLAQRGALAVNPIGGWWKDNKNVTPNRCVARYAMVVEIDAQNANVDIYSEIKAKIATPVVLQE